MPRRLGVGRARRRHVCEDEGGFVAADALLIDKFACAAAIPAWLQADDQGRGEDRRFFQAIRALPNGATGQPTISASIHVQNQHPFTLAQFRERGVVLERFITMTPELERDIAHALKAQRDYERSVKENFKFGNVEFVRPKDGEGRWRRVRRRTSRASSCVPSFPRSPVPARASRAGTDRRDDREAHEDQAVHRGRAEVDPARPEALLDRGNRPSPFSTTSAGAYQ
jgi:hypothetical protein